MGIRVLVLKYDTCSLRSTKFGTIGHVQCVCALFYNLQPYFIIYSRLSTSILSTDDRYFNKDNTNLKPYSEVVPVFVLWSHSLLHTCLD
jgi:hypothetical protein